jgi:hypothetical protein
LRRDGFELNQAALWIEIQADHSGALGRRIKWRNLSVAKDED